MSHDEFLPSNSAESGKNSIFFMALQKKFIKPNKYLLSSDILYLIFRSILQEYGMISRMPWTDVTMDLFQKNTVTVAV